MQEYQFYMVWNETTRKISFKHGNALAARQEAERLARLNPGVKFYVMASVGFARAQDPVTWVQADEHPF